MLSVLKEIYTLQAMSHTHSVGGPPARPGHTELGPYENRIRWFGWRSPLALSEPGTRRSWQSRAGCARSLFLVQSKPSKSRPCAGAKDFGRETALFSRAFILTFFLKFSYFVAISQNCLENSHQYGEQCSVWLTFFLGIWLCRQGLSRHSGLTSQLEALRLEEESVLMLQNRKSQWELTRQVDFLLWLHRGP